MFIPQSGVLVQQPAQAPVSAQFGLQEGVYACTRRLSMTPSHFQLVDRKGISMQYIDAVYVYRQRLPWQQAFAMVTGSRYVVQVSGFSVVCGRHSRSMCSMHSRGQTGALLLWSQLEVGRQGFHVHILLSHKWFTSCSSVSTPASRRPD